MNLDAITTRGLPSYFILDEEIASQLSGARSEKKSQTESEAAMKNVDEKMASAKSQSAFNSREYVSPSGSTRSETLEAKGVKRRLEQSSPLVRVSSSQNPPG